MEKIKYQHPSGKLTIIWEPTKCIHSGICVKTLPKVYHPKDRPWITPENASVDEIVSQINNCPSGALTYELNPNK